MKFFEIKCPCCNTTLVIDRLDGKVVEERKPLIEDSTGDRFKDAMIKTKQQKAVVEKKFKDSESAHKKRAQSLDSIFKESLKKVKENDDGTKPFNPMDVG